METLTRTPGVRSAERLSPGRFGLRLGPDAAVATIAQRLVESGWGLRELTPQRHDLGRVFLNIVGGAGAP